MSAPSAISCRMLNPEEFLALSPSEDAFPSTMGNMHVHDKSMFFCAFAKDQLVGVVKLGVFDMNIAIDFLETSATTLNRGVAKEMLRGLFEYAQSHNTTIANQGFTESGKSYLLNEISRLQSEFPGRWHDIPGV